MVRKSLCCIPARPVLLEVKNINGVPRPSLFTPENPSIKDINFANINFLSCLRFFPRVAFATIVSGIVWSHSSHRRPLTIRISPNRPSQTPLTFLLNFLYFFSQPMSVRLNPPTSPYLLSSLQDIALNSSQKHQTSHSSSTMSVPNQVSKNVILLPQTNQLRGLYSIIRDQLTKRGDFVFYSDRIIRLLVEEGLNQLPVEEAVIECHGGHKYNGSKFLGKICGVSIVRAGESMEMGLRDCCRSVRIGKRFCCPEESRWTVSSF